MIRVRIIIAAVLAGIAAISCQSVDDTRIPPAQVSISFTTVGDWNVYGVAGALSARRFIKSDRVPADFPYSDMSATGYGGVLLVSDFDGVYKAYDLSCPVEKKRDVRIVVSSELSVGECPVCHSTYDVFRLGSPLSGEAAERGYALTRYRVSVNPTSTPYALISN